MRQRRGIENGFTIPPTGTDDIFRIARAFEYSRAFHIANNIDVFTELHAGPLTVEELAARLNVDARDLEKVLIVNAAMGLLITDGEKWCNGLLGDRYLVRTAPEYIGDAIWLMGNWWNRFDELGKKMVSQWELRTPKSDLPAFHERFIHAMNDYAVNGEALQVAEMLDLSGRKHLLDLGGGPGTYSVFLCEKYPDLRATVLDVPQTEPIFRQVVDSYGMADRITFMAGDVEKDDFGTGYDVVFASSMMHGYWGDVIPPKASRALEPGGIIIVRDALLASDKSGPLAAAMYNMRMGAYTEDEMYDFLTAAGFTHPTCCEQGDNTIVLARKPG